MNVYKCAYAGKEYWAGGTATKNGKKQAFFLKAVNSKWTYVNPDEICGTASAGMPPELLAFCPSPS